MHFQGLLQSILSKLSIIKLLPTSEFYTVWGLKFLEGWAMATQADFFFPKLIFVYGKQIMTRLSREQVTWKDF